jgi:hypothetical protein
MPSAGRDTPDKFSETTMVYAAFSNDNNFSFDESFRNS